MKIGIISEDKTDCLAIQALIDNITKAKHEYYHGHKNGKDAIIPHKKTFVSLLSNLKCEVIFIVRDSDGEDSELIIDELKGAYNSTIIGGRTHYCIAVEELESWLMTDMDNLIDFYDLPSNSGISFAARPDELHSPKEILKEYISKKSKNLNQYFTSDAARIAQSLDTEKAKSASPSFSTFHEAISMNVH